MQLKQNWLASKPVQSIPYLKEAKINFNLTKALQNKSKIVKIERIAFL